MKLALVAGAAGTTSLTAQPAYAADEATIAAAKKEGSVLIYSPAQTNSLDGLTKAFNAKYPGISAEYYRGTSGQIYQRLTAELAADRVQVDIMHVADPATMIDFKQKGLLASYQSPEYVNYDKKYVDKDSTFFITRGHLLMMGYNPTVVSGADIPKNWKDLLNPKFNGRIGVPDVRSTGGSYYWMYAVWKAYGPGYFDEMYKNQPKVYASYGPINDNIITGELAFGAELNYLTDQSVIENKAPVVGVYPEEGSAVVWSPAAIVKKGPHQNAARLFIDFFASPEGQEVFNRDFTYSMRSGVPAREGMTPLDKIKLMDIDLDEFISRQAEIQAAARKAWHV